MSKRLANQESRVTDLDDLNAKKFKSQADSHADAETQVRNHALISKTTKSCNSEMSINGNGDDAGSKKGNQQNFEKPGTELKIPPSNPAVDRDYFASYSGLDIHRTMIDDSARTQAYRHAILTNYPLFYGKVVLDVGCGTGILSVFCCLAGARRVYAVDASGAAEFARAVAAENGYSDRIRVLQCRAEEAELPEQVDVIVSEWMGHALLYESMLDSVLVARDRWLRPGGALFPERAVLRMALCTAPELALETGGAQFWRGVYDRYKVRMTCLAEVEERRRWSDLPARVCALLPEELHSHAATVCDLNLRTVRAEELRELRAPAVELQSFGRAQLTGLALWFDVHFPGGDELSTSPYVTETHWGQTVLPLEPVNVDQDSTVQCPMVMRPDPKHPRNWRFSVDLAVGDGDSRSIQWVMDGTG
ncbi:protein arginine N-methyltransferase 6-like [Amphibalanus amphitrite]|uniref:protein arginine N-methyltransferase 6-like n=1 Tax=Amphibalanus amphitrite TaxID=1232801 RepID=UPI001C91269C|nr:protein arginine N-methyltransferase 6-like [Amphibalanus amphitrite]